MSVTRMGESEAYGGVHSRLTRILVSVHGLSSVEDTPTGSLEQFRGRCGGVDALELIR
jgi:hypothetical protein